MDPSHGRNWLTFALLCLVGGAVEIYTLAAHHTSHLEATGTHRVVIEEFGGRVPITQTFTMPTDGLDAVRVLLSAPEAVTVLFDWQLSEQKQPNTFALLYRNRQTVRVAAGERWETIAFSPILDSAGKQYRLELQVVDTKSDGSTSRSMQQRQPVAIVASLDRSVRRGFLKIGTRDHWGDLVFDTHASGDTILGRFQLRTLPGLPALLGQRSVLWAVFLVYNLSLVIVAFQCWPTSRPTPGIAPSRPRHAVRAGVVSIGLVAALIAIYGERTRAPRVDLIDELYTADFQSNPMTMNVAFDLRDEAVPDDETMPAIFAHTQSQITWTLTVPANVSLRTALVIDPGAWPLGGADGVVFRIGVSEQDRYTELFMQHIDPSHNVRDRRWTPVAIDLTRFSGRRVQLIFRTEPSLPGQPDNPGYDWALWGAPRLVDN